MTWVKRLLLWPLAALAALVVLFLLSAWIGSSIPRGSEPPDTIADPVTIMVETNGFHTQFVLPISNAHKDWRETFPSTNEWVHGWPPTHVAIGFGEREVFLHTPTITDLKPSTALRVAGVGGDGLIRVSNLVNPPLGRGRRELTITGEQYSKLVEAILADLPDLGDAAYRTYEFGSYDKDAYYESTRDYTITSTCNQWTSDRMANAGIRTGYWTPFSGGVMKWLPPYRTELGEI